MKKTFLFLLLVISAAIAQAGVNPPIVGNGATDSVWIEFAINDTLGNAADADSVWLIRFYRQWVVDSVKVTASERTGFYRQAFKSSMNADSTGGYSINVRAFGVTGRTPQTTYSYLVLNGGPALEASLTTMQAQIDSVHDSTAYLNATGVNVNKVNDEVAAADSLRKWLTTYGAMIADAHKLDGDTAHLELLTDLLTQAYVSTANYILAGVRYWFTGSAMAGVTATSNVPDVNPYTIDGSADAADSLRLRLLRDDIQDITANLAALGMADSAQVGAAAALVAIALDHLLSVAIVGTDVTDNSAFAKIASKSATADWDSYNNTTDALEALRDRGDAAWTTGGSGSLTEAGEDSLSDAVNKFLLQLANDTTKTIVEKLTEITDSLSTQGWAAVGGAGSGSQVDSIFVIDTSGVDAPVPGVKVTIFNSAQSAIVAAPNPTTATGYTIAGLDTSTAYVGQAVLQGYTFDLKSFTTGSGATSNDTIFGYNYAVTALSSSAQKTTLYDWALGPRGDTLAYATVKITLNGSGPMYTSTETITKKTETVYTDANGYWTALVFGTDSTSNCDNITIEIIEAGATDAINKFEKVVVPANGTTTQLRGLLKP